jgi:ubiquinone/menaquinone biosynthesis C-methylase UbiE
MGNGKLMSYVLEASPNCRYYGCDYSELMVEESARNNQDLVDTGQLSFHHCHAHDLPIADSSIDRLFSVNTIYFWENPVEILQEFKRVLRPGGKICLGLRPRRLMQHYDFVKYGFNMFEGEDVIELLTSNGLVNAQASIFEEEDWVTDDQRFEVESVVVSAQI